MKTVYMYNDQKTLVDAKHVPDNYNLASNETFLNPDRKLYPPYTLSADGTSWNGLTLEEYKKAHPSQPVRPTAEQQTIMQQQQQIVSLNESRKQLQQTAMQQQVTMAQLQQLAMQQQMALAKMREGN